MLVFPMFLKRRLVAVPLPLPQGALKQPNGGTRAPVTNDLVLTGGLTISDSKASNFFAGHHLFIAPFKISLSQKGGLKTRRSGGWFSTR